MNTRDAWLTAYRGCFSKEAAPVPTGWTQQRLFLEKLVEDFRKGLEARRQVEALGVLAPIKQRVLPMQKPTLPVKG